MSDVPAATAGPTGNAIRMVGTTTNPPPRPTIEPRILATTPAMNSMTYGAARGGVSSSRYQTPLGRNPPLSVGQRD